MTIHVPQPKKRRRVSGDSVWDAQGQLMDWCVTRAPRVIPNSHAIIVPRPTNFFRIQIYFFLRDSVKKRHEKNDTKKKLSTIFIILVTVDEYQVRLHGNGFLAEHSSSQSP